MLFVDETGWFLHSGDAEDVVPVAVEEATKPKIEVVELDESTSPELPVTDYIPLRNLFQLGMGASHS